MGWGNYTSSGDTVPLPGILEAPGCAFTIEKDRDSPRVRGEYPPLIHRLFRLIVKLLFLLAIYW